MHIHLKVRTDILLKELHIKIAQIRECNLDPTQVKTEIVLFQMTGDRSVRGVFNPE